MNGLHGGESAGNAASGPPLGLPTLTGMLVLIVEDELLVSMVLADLLDEFGCTVAGQAATVSEALDRIETGDDFDAAILDVNIGGDKVFPVADLLIRRGVPFVFSTGYGPADLAQRYPGRPLLHKPYRPEALATVLEGFVHGA
jgi:CheY-like chemotaxis protein